MLFRTKNNEFQLVNLLSNKREVYWHNLMLILDARDRLSVNLFEPEINRNYYNRIALGMEERAFGFIMRRKSKVSERALLSIKHLADGFQ